MTSIDGANPRSRRPWSSSPSRERRGARRDMASGVRVLPTTTTTPRERFATRLATPTPPRRRRVVVTGAVPGGARGGARGGKRGGRAESGEREDGRAHRRRRRRPPESRGGGGTRRERDGRADVPRDAFPRRERRARAMTRAFLVDYDASVETFFHFVTPRMYVAHRVAVIAAWPVRSVSSETSVASSARDKARRDETRFFFSNEAFFFITSRDACVPSFFPVFSRASEKTPPLSGRASWRSTRSGSRPGRT